jgi:very-short-patch-repair endonuclease
MKADRKTRARAKRLRRELTDAERILWSRLKERQLRNWQFRVQHPYSPYIPDFVCAPLRLIVEVDGATHSSLDEREHDERRRAFLEERGWTILRFWNHEVYTNLHGVLETIAARLPEKEARVRRSSRQAALRAGPLRHPASPDATSPNPSD